MPRSLLSLSLSLALSLSSLTFSEYPLSKLVLARSASISSFPPFSPGSIYSASPLSSSTEILLCTLGISGRPATPVTEERAETHCEVRDWEGVRKGNLRPFAKVMSKPVVPSVHGVAPVVEGEAISMVIMEFGSGCVGGADDPGGVGWRWRVPSTVSFPR